MTRELFSRLAINQMAVCRSAMREGMLAEYVSRHLPDLTVRRTVPDPRRRSVLDLARRCDWHKEHSEHAAELTLQLFDGLCSLHGLKGSARELIEYGAMLHDIGWHIHPDQHHKHALYLITHGGLKGFQPEEVRIIANIARYHRKSPPSLKHKPYRALSAKGRKVVRVARPCCASPIRWTARMSGSYVASRSPNGKARSACGSSAAATWNLSYGPPAAKRNCSRM